MRKSPVVEETASEVEVPANGHSEEAPAPSTLVRTSTSPDDWDIKELEDDDEETTQAKAEFEKARADDPGAQIEAMTAEEAEETLRQLTENEGRLPLEIRRRGGESETYYVRMPKTYEIGVGERAYVIAFHKNRKEGIPSLSEFLQELIEGLTLSQREKYEEIEDGDLQGFAKSQALLDFFLTETPHVGLVQMTADVLARRDQNAYLVSCCVEKFEETDGKKKWLPVWPTSSDYAKEDSDVSMSVLLDVLTAHEKLASARFLPLSSDEAKPGNPKS